MKTIVFRTEVRSPLYGRFERGAIATVPATWADDLVKAGYADYTDQAPTQPTNDGSAA